MIFCNETNAATACQPHTNLHWFILVDCS